MFVIHIYIFYSAYDICRLTVGIVLRLHELVKYKHFSVSLRYVAFDTHLCRFFFCLVSLNQNISKILREGKTRERRQDDSGEEEEEEAK